MSRRDIQTVCELAAHLAQRWHKPHEGASHAPHNCPPEQAAADAMRLQRLGRSARNALDRVYTTKTQVKCDQAWERIRWEAEGVLNPYGLKAECRDEPFSAECLFIIGLPSNTKDCGEGYAI